VLLAAAAPSLRPPLQGSELMSWARLRAGGETAGSRSRSQTNLGGGGGRLVVVPQGRGGGLRLSASCGQQPGLAPGGFLHSLHGGLAEAGSDSHIAHRSTGAAWEPPAHTPHTNEPKTHLAIADSRCSGLNALIMSSAANGPTRAPACAGSAHSSLPAAVLGPPPQLLAAAPAAQGPQTAASARLASRTSAGRAEARAT
jgi:hypothetical protein